MSESISGTGFGIGASGQYSKSLTQLNQKLFFGGYKGTAGGLAIGGEMGYKMSQFGSSLMNLKENAGAFEKGNTNGFYGKAIGYVNPHDTGFFAQGSAEYTVGFEDGIYKSGLGLDGKIQNYELEAGYAGVSQYSNCGHVDDNLIKFSLGAGMEKNAVNPEFDNKSLFGKVKWEHGHGVATFKAGAMKTEQGPTIQPFGEVSYAIGLNSTERKRKY